MLSDIQILNSATGLDRVLEISNARNPGSVYIRKVDGLSPTKASVAYSTYARLPGGVFHSSRREVRNIVINVAYNENFKTGETIESLRRGLEQVAVPGDRIRIRTRNNGSYKYIYGYVESIESTMFDRDPETVISIICTDPFFFGASVELTGTSGEWLRLTYAGTSPTGFEIELVAASDSTGTSVLSSPTDGKLSLSTDLLAGQRISINTEVGKKNARRIWSDGSIAKRLLGDVTIEKDWPILLPGSNSVLVSVGGTNGSYKLRYREYYESGV